MIWPFCAAGWPLGTLGWPFGATGWSLGFWIATLVNWIATWGPLMITYGNFMATWGHLDSHLELLDGHIGPSDECGGHLNGWMEPYDDNFEPLGDLKWPMKGHSGLQLLGLALKNRSGKEWSQSGTPPSICKLNQLKTLVKRQRIQQDLLHIFIYASSQSYRNFKAIRSSISSETDSFYLIAQPSFT